MCFKTTQNYPKYLGNFGTKHCQQELLKIVLSGHTADPTYFCDEIGRQKEGRLPSYIDSKILNTCWPLLTPFLVLGR